MSDELLERIADALERIGDQLDIIQDQLEQLGGYRPAALPSPKPLLPVSAQEMLVAVGHAVQETRATSLDHLGMVIKAARSKLKE